MNASQIPSIIPAKAKLDIKKHPKALRNIFKVFGFAAINTMTTEQDTRSIIEKNIPKSGKKIIKEYTAPIDDEIKIRIRYGEACIIAHMDRSKK